MLPRALVLSSDVRTAEVLQDVLADTCDVQVCREIFSAVEQITTGTYQVVVIEWQEPLEAAFLLGAVRDLNAKRNIFAVAIVTSAQAREALENGADAVLAKPFTREQLRETLSSRAQSNAEKHSEALSQPNSFRSADAAVCGVSSSLTAAAVAPGQTFERQEELYPIRVPVVQVRPSIPTAPRRSRLPRVLSVAAVVWPLIIAAAMLTFDRWDDLKLNRASGELKRTFLEGVSQRFPASRPDEGAVKRPVPAYEIHDDLLADYSSGPRSYAPRESSPEPRSADEIAGAELQLLPAATRSVSAVWPAEAIQLARDLPQSLRFPPPASSPQTFYPTGHLVAPDWLDGPITLPEAISRSLLEQQVAPEYPKEVRPWLDGSVVLQASIASDGTVREVKLLSGYLALGRAAAQAVKQWRYRPYRHNGRNVAVQTLITVDFKRPPQG